MRHAILAPRVLRWCAPGNIDFVDRPTSTAIMVWTIIPGVLYFSSTTKCTAAGMKSQEYEYYNATMILIAKIDQVEMSFFSTR